MNFEKAYGETSRREAEGAWFRASEVFASSGLSDGDDVAQIKLASSGAGNPRYQRFVLGQTLARSGEDRRALQMLLDGTARGSTNAERAMRALDESLGIQYRAYAETIVLDWKGFTDAAGEELPYSAEYMAQVFEKYPRAFDDIKNFVEKLENFRRDAIEDAVKN